MTLDEARAEVAQRRVFERLRAAGALADFGAFILGQLLEAEEGRSAEALGAVLDARGWLAIARLLRAGLIDENGRMIYATEAGEHIYAQFESRLATIGD